MKFLQLDFLKQAVNNPALVKQDKAWLTHIRPALALVKPQNSPRLSAFATFLQEDQALGKVSGEMITTSHLRHILKILQSSNRSDILSDSQTQVTHYSAAVPIGLLAFKEVYGIPYSSWELDDAWMAAAMLSKPLADIDNVRSYLAQIEGYKPDIGNYTEMGDQEYCDQNGLTMPEIIFPFDHETQREWRHQTLGDGAIKSTEYNKLKRVYGTSHAMGSENLSKFYWCMLTQTHIFDPSIRHPDMITNLEDIDKPATPLEEFVEIKKVEMPFRL